MRLYCFLLSNIAPGGTLSHSGFQTRYAAIQAHVRVRNPNKVCAQALSRNIARAVNGDAGAFLYLYGRKKMFTEREVSFDKLGLSADRWSIEQPPPENKASAKVGTRRPEKSECGYSAPLSH